MKHAIYRKILLNREAGKKMLAVLIDAEKSHGRNFASVVATLKVACPDFIIIGGNHQVRSIDSMIAILKEEIDSDVLIFPGDVAQFSANADALLYLSLLSGRNPEYLIGHHVKSSLAVVDSGIEVIPTAYLLIDGGKISAMEYLSNTRSIPRDQYELILSTALAGELMGMRITFLDAGSNAAFPISETVIKFIKDRTLSPLIVSGGINSIDDLENAMKAGADIVVINNESLSDKSDKLVGYINRVKQLNQHLQDA